MNKNLWLGLVVLAIVIVVGGIWLLRDRQGGAEEIKIGAALGLTGICADWGEGELKAEQLAVDDANKAGSTVGKRIKLVSEDTGCDPKGTVNAVEKLVSSDHVALILGPTWGDSFEAGTIFSNNAKVPAISPSTAMEALIYNKQPIDYVFSTWFPERSEVDTLQVYAEKMREKRIIVLHDEDPFGSMMANLFVTQAPSRKLSVIHEEQFPIGFEDFRTTIAKLKGIKPDAVFVAFQGPGPKIKFLKQAYDLGLHVQLLSSSDIEDNDLLAQAGGVMEGVIYTRPQASGNQTTFTTEYQARYGSLPSGQSASNAYDATRVALAALTAHATTGVDLAAAIQSIDISGTAVPEIKFNQDHQLTGAAFELKTVRNGKFIVLE